MTRELFFVVGEGVRVFRKSEDSDDPSVRPHLIEIATESVGVEERPDGRRDRPGRFEKGDSAIFRDGLVGGENHAREGEQRRRRDVSASEEIEKVLEEGGYPASQIVAPKERLPEILSNLSSTAANALKTRHRGNWCKLNIAEIESRLL